MPIHGLSQNGYLNDQWAKPPMQAIFKGIFMDITEPFKDHIKDNIYIYIYIYITCMQENRRNKQVPFINHLVYKFLGILFLQK